jgi:hypothetical protein
MLSMKSPDSGSLGRVTASVVEALRIIACTVSSFPVHKPAFMPRRHQGYDTFSFAERQHNGIRQGNAGDPAAAAADRSDGSLSILTRHHGTASGRHG